MEDQRILVMGYEELAPGQSIRPHRHLTADEIIFVHAGSGLVFLGDREAQVNAGGTVYIPANTRISLRNTGNVPLAIAYIFSKPGFEDIQRENSVLEGQPATVITPEERARRCRRDVCWNLFGAVSGWMRILDQAARSIGLSASFWVRVSHPSTLRMMI
jgi:Cupin domain